MLLMESNCLLKGLFFVALWNVLPVQRWVLCLGTIQWKLLGLQINVSMHYPLLETLKKPVCINFIWILQEFVHKKQGSWNLININWKISYSIFLCERVFGKQNQYCIVFLYLQMPHSVWNIAYCLIWCKPEARWKRWKLVTTSKLFCVFGFNKIRSKETTNSKERLLKLNQVSISDAHLFLCCTLSEEHEVHAVWGWWKRAVSCLCGVRIEAPWDEVPGSGFLNLRRWRMEGVACSLICFWKKEKESFHYFIKLNSR